VLLSLIKVSIKERSTLMLSAMSIALALLVAAMGQDCEVLSGMA
jgi:hypothetical protein